RAAQNGPDRAIAPILERAQAIAVLDPGIPSSDRPLPPVEPVVDADIFRQNVATPAIVIAGDHDHRNPGLAQIGEGGENAEARSRNDGLPLEPEFEQIAVDDDGGGGR